MQGAPGGGAGQHAVGRRHEQFLAPGHDADVFRCAFGEVAAFVERHGKIDAEVDRLFFHEHVGQVVAGLDRGEEAGLDRNLAHGHADAATDSSGLRPL